LRLSQGNATRLSYRERTLPAAAGYATWNPSFGLYRPPPAHL